MCECFILVRTHIAHCNPQCIQNGIYPIHANKHTQHIKRRCEQILELTASVSKFSFSFFSLSLSLPVSVPQNTNCILLVSWACMCGCVCVRVPGPSVGQMNCYFTLGESSLIQLGLDAFCTLCM